MSYIIYSTIADAPVARCDGHLCEIMLREGEIAIPCAPGADPNDPAWCVEAGQYDVKYCVLNARTLAMERIDRLACEARARYITTGAGQEATYQIKADEAAGYIAAGRPADTSSWPLLSAEASATGITVNELADTVIATRQQWISLAAMIESRRMGGKALIASLNDVDEIALAFGALSQQLMSI